MDKQKYLLFGDAAYPHIYKWYKELNKQFDVHVITFANQEKIEFEYENLICISREVNAKGSNIALLFSLFRVFKLIRLIKPKYVNAHYATSYGFIAAIISCFLKFKLIISTWGTDILVTPYKNVAYKTITRFTLNKANIVTSDSDFMSYHIAKLSIRSVDQILTFPMGIEKNEIPKEVVNKSKKTFLSLRTLNENSNVDIIIQAFSIMTKECPDVELVIAHKGSEEAKLKELSKGLNIRFVGFLNREELIQIMSEAKFYLSIPTSDSISVSLIETMAYGCIPILSNIAANREVINNSNGLISELKVNDLVLVMKEAYEMLDKDSDKIRLINYELIKNKYVWENNIKKYIDEVKI